MASNCGTIVVESAFDQSSVFISTCVFPDAFRDEATVTAGDTVSVGAEVTNNNENGASVTVGVYLNGTQRETTTHTVRSTPRAFGFDVTPTSAGQFDVTTNIESVSEA